MANLILDQNVPRVGRVPRRPLHPFHLKTVPFAIQPMCIAPVLPGETVKNILLQSRVVSQPVKNPLIGWWKEYYFFYVRHSQLDGADDFKQMMLDFEHSLASYVPSATNAKYYQFDDNGGIDWVGQCLKLVTEEYFRDEGEAWNNITIDGLPAAALNADSWLDSLRDITSIPDGGDLGDIEAAAEDVTMAALDKAFTTWQFLQAQNLTNQTYEEWLRAHGIRGALAEDPRTPELIRYVRDWTYPSNTIGTSGEDLGVPASALSWSMSERADKDRFISEPGFIFGVTITRPKVYRAKQKGTLVQWLDNAMMWVPMTLAGNPETSLREFANNQGPLAGNITNGYLVDMRDLFIYGDQFANFDIDADTTGVGIDVPTTAGVHKYPTETMVDTLFVSGDATDGVREDGVVSFNILGRQRDHT